MTREAFARHSTDEAVHLLETLAQIPAPLHGEGARAAFCLDWLRAQGADPALDAAGNVVCRFGDGGGDLTVFLAHLDVVFPDTASLPLRREGNRLYCPGVGDDTANLVNLLLCCKYLAQTDETPRCGLLLAANVGEEGLGNLRGARELFRQYGGRVRACYSFDSFGLNRIAATAVGSHRYRLRVSAEGGHSWFDFGRRNAIADLARVISRLDGQALPQGNRTSFNFGVVSGGTSVNTIAQEASVLYEYRSASNDCLEAMRTQLEQTLDGLRAEGVCITSELLGERPAMAQMDEAALREFTARTVALVERVTGKAAELYESSTDANIPLSMGIPALTVGTVRAGGMHTREEWADLDSLPDGLCLALALVGQYLE